MQYILHILPIHEEKKRFKCDMCDYSCLGYDFDLIWEENNAKIVPLFV